MEIFKAAKLTIKVQNKRIVSRNRGEFELSGSDVAGTIGLEPSAALTYNLFTKHPNRERISLQVLAICKYA